MNTVIKFIKDNFSDELDNIIWLNKNGFFFSQKCAEVGWPLHKKTSLEILECSEERSKRRRISLPLLSPPLAQAPEYLLKASVQQKSMQPPTQKV